MNCQPRVAHTKSPYLGYSETFIHNYIIHHQRYESVVVTAQTKNLDQFPVNHLVTVPAWWAPLEKLRRFVTSRLRRFMIRELLYEAGYVKVLRGVQPDVIHAHFGIQGLLMLPVKRRLSIPMVVSFYGLDLSEFPMHHGEDVYIRHHMFEETERFTVEGGFAKQTLIGLGCPEKKIALVHIGVNLNKFEFVPRRLNMGEEVRILFVGRLIEKKGLLYALQAVARLREQTESFEFTIIGDGPQRPEAERLTAELGLSPFVRFLGIVHYADYQRACRGAHILLAPSVTDLKTGSTEGGAPTVLLEAQATGLSVISTLHADIPEVVHDGVSGLLSPERDVEALAANLATLVRSPERWAGMGLAGRRHIEDNYEITAQVQRLEEVYDTARIGMQNCSSARMRKES